MLFCLCPVNFFLLETSINTKQSLVLLFKSGTNFKTTDVTHIATTQAVVVHRKEPRFVKFSYFEIIRQIVSSTLLLCYLHIQKSFA